MGKYFPDHSWVFSAIAPGMALPPTSLWSNAGNNPHVATAFTTGLNIDKVN
jgi:hypothetical protein